MDKLPKKFPEYCIMYKTINKKISELKKKKETIQDVGNLNEIQTSIEKYLEELEKIESMFPRDFFKKI